VRTAWSIFDHPLNRLHFIRKGHKEILRSNMFSWEWLSGKGFWVYKLEKKREMLNQITANVLNRLIKYRKWYLELTLSVEEQKFPCDTHRFYVHLMRRRSRIRDYILIYHKTNDYIRRELRITGIRDKIDEYRRSWLLHLQRMPQNRIPLKSYHCRPQGRRTIGRPKKRWR